MSQRFVWVCAALLLCVSACANIWSFQDFQSEGEDASVDGASAHPDGGSHADAALDARDAGTRDGARDAHDADADAACPIGMCNGVCIDTMRDPKNCGGCGTVCAAGEPCQGGMCICPGNEHLCSAADAGTCVSTMTDEANCGGCGNKCAVGATCVSSACSCPTGQKVCTTGTTSTCVDLLSDPGNCGGCGTVCGITASCVGGTCQPCGAVATQTMCGTPVRCVDNATDPKNCGTCGTTCLASEVCKNSKCVCPGSQSLCGTPTSGICYDLSVSQKNCGSCGNACAGGTVCLGGNCVCPPGTHSCGVGAAATCLLNTSTSSCGTTSCNVCPIPGGGTSTCNGTSCGQSCGSAAAPTLCPPGGGANAACVNITTDPNHCGACSTPCNTTNAIESCAASICAVASCNAGFANCDRLASNGCEIDTANDTSNCGTCSNACPMSGAVEVCTRGSCMVSNCPKAGTADCDGNPKNGCEVNTTNDPNNCGGCGRACNMDNATEGCTGSKCAIAACTPGFADCDKSPANGCEINLTNDTSNCGGCGKACSQNGGTGTCVGSTCKITCDSGFADCDGNVANGCETAITTTSNCAGCGKACSTTQATEACSSTSGGYACSVTTCNTGFANCDHNASNGCEININADAMNCGGCGKPCSTVGGAVESCSGGACTLLNCGAGFADCDHVVKNGCETNLTTASNCGACFNACSTNHVTESCTLAAGVYSCTIPANGCAAGYADCDKDPANGCEVNIGADTTNCGGCGHVCTAVGGTSTCTGGSCGVVCKSPNADCDMNPANGCEVNTSTDPSHCGSCTTPCSMNNATEVCSSSVCSIMSCAAGFMDCDMNAANGCEVNTNTDTSNCGACKAKCSTANATEACTGGACSITTCKAGFTDCNMSASDGCETHTANDPAHCGSCTNACSMVGGTQGCSGGVCGGLACVPPAADCDMNSANGCEVNTSTDPNNCGSCGLKCSTNNVTEVCASSKCAIQSCTVGFADCNMNATDGCEVNTTSDASNCSGCGKTCSQVGGTGSCVGAACKMACSVGFADCDMNVTNGCEVNTTNDTGNCGTCANKCSMNNATENCTASKCTVQSCAVGFGDCDHSAANGCEANTNSDTSNCGACGAKCSTSHAVEVCTGGNCSVMSCTAPFADCDGNPANGCEVNLSTDLANCGACGNLCSTNNATEVCTSSGGGFSCTVMSCATGFKDCDGNALNGCETNVSTDASNCGACGSPCPTGAGCSGSMCGSCPAGTIPCMNTCATCPAPPTNGGTTCSGTTCVGACNNPLFPNPCGNACVNFSTDPSNCGGCGNAHACPTGAGCSGGTCGCPAGTMNCMNTCAACPAPPTNGGTTCSGATCVGACNNSAFPDSCGNACVNFSTDPSNCGGCGNAHACPTGVGCSGGTCASCPAGTMNCMNTCATCPAPPTNGGTTCSGATCVGACNNAAFPDSCGNACVNFLTDPSNCGGCGNAHACPTGVGCSGGTCASCPAGTMNCMNTCATCPAPPTNGGTTCSGATCVGACNNPLFPNSCGNACVNFLTDPSNCGGCGTSCADAGLTLCVSGGCQ